MKKKNFYIGLITVLTGICLSLGWHHHQIRPLSMIASSVASTFDSEEKMLYVDAKALSSEECIKALGYDLISQGIQPIQFTIQNNSPYEYSFSPDFIDLNHIDSKKVAHILQKSNLPRTIGFKILGFLFWPFMIPGTIDTIHTFHSYKSLKKDYSAKAMKQEIIPVYSIFNRILFVSQTDLKEDFSMSLVETKKQRLTTFEFSAGENPIQEDLELIVNPEEALREAT